MTGEHGLLLGSGFEDHAIALTLEQLDGATGDAVSMAAVVVVGAGVAVRSAAREDVIDRSEHGMGDGDDSLLVSPMAHDAAIPRRQGALLGADGGQGRFDEAMRNQRLPLRILLGLCLPALSRFPGQRPTQLARCRSLGKGRMSGPISARRTSAVRRAIPGTVSSCSSWLAKGARCVSTSALTAAIASSRYSRWANSCPTRRRGGAGTAPRALGAGRPASCATGPAPSRPAPRDRSCPAPTPPAWRGPRRPGCRWPPRPA